MSKIIIIDDDLNICEMLKMSFEKMGHAAEHYQTLKDGLEKVFSNEFDIVFLDVNLPDGNGLESIETIRDQSFAPEIIIMTGAGDPEGAELAMKSHAWDYIQKSCSHKEFRFSLARALEYRKQKRSRPGKKIIKRDSIIGESHKIKACLEQLAKASNNDSPVLVTGETGTGKELFAKAIYDNSRSNNNDFIVVDCTALPEHLVESVLFGHKKGAFTGADEDKTGLIELADGGVLFLDEVGELPQDIQKKFLRVLQEKKFRPLGSKKEVSSDFKLVSATHRDVSKMIEQNLFREDFYFRISTIKIEIPPLRNRKTDIALLVPYYINKKSDDTDNIDHEIFPELITDLLGYNWPGNIRELFNAIDYACSEAFNEEILFSRHLPEYIRTIIIQKKLKRTDNDPLAKPSLLETKAPVEKLSLKDYVETMKHKYIMDLIAHTRGDIKNACLLSGLSRGHLYALLKKFDISSS